MSNTHPTVRIRYFTLNDKDFSLIAPRISAIFHANARNLARIRFAEA